eukprot:scaffold127988_cov30-Tisochrysis_lutea.AAC.4
MGDPEARSVSELVLGPPLATCSRSANPRVSPGNSLKDVGIFHGAVRLRSGIPRFPSVAGHGVCGF